LISVIGFLHAGSAVERTRGGLISTLGFEPSLRLMSPADKAYAALSDGEVDFVAAEAHAALALFPRWRGIKLICAQAQGMYWFLVVRADLGAERGDGR
jgi:NitT/TauT family transport system substrate-binding protein